MTSFDRIERAFGLVKSEIANLIMLTQKGAQYEVTLQTLVSALAGLANSREMAILKGMLKDAVAGYLEDESFSPCAAAEPAHLLMDALDDIAKGGQQLIDWTNDQRFHTQFRPLREWRLATRVPPAEVLEQMTYLITLLHACSRQAALAATKMQGYRNPLRPVVTDRKPADVPEFDAQTPARLVALPRQPYRSDGDKVKDMRLRIQLLGTFLVKIGQRGSQRIEGASLRMRAYSPNVVVAEAVTLTYTLTHVLLTCAALARMTSACDAKESEARELSPAGAPPLAPTAS
jgi:hypothetical protein